MPVSQINYKFILVEEDRVCFVNGKWAGKKPQKEKGALESCIFIWDFLVQVGREGWQVETAMPWALPKVAVIRGNPKERAPFSHAFVLRR